MLSPVSVSVQLISPVASASVTSPADSFFSEGSFWGPKLLASRLGTPTHHLTSPLYRVNWQFTEIRKSNVSAHVVDLARAALLVVNVPSLQLKSVAICQPWNHAGLVPRDLNSTSVNSPTSCFGLASARALLEVRRSPKALLDSSHHPHNLRGILSLWSQTKVQSWYELCKLIVMDVRRHWDDALCSFFSWIHYLGSFIRLGRQRVVCGDRALVQLSPPSSIWIAGVCLCAIEAWCTGLLLHPPSTLHPLLL